MVESAREAIEHGNVTRLTFRCSPYDTHSALHSVRAHLERVLQMRDNENAQSKWEKLEAMLADYDFPQAETVDLFAKLLSISLPGDLSPLPLTPAQEKDQTLNGLVAWIIEESEQHPILIIWEGLHYADPSSLELINLLVDHLPIMRTMVLFTARPEYLSPWGMRAHITTHTLGRLGAAHIEAICRRISGDRALPAEVLNQIVERTDGVPLFVEELTKAILESDVLTDVDGIYELAKPLSSISLPGTLNCTAGPTGVGQSHRPDRLRHWTRS